MKKNIYNIIGLLLLIIIILFLGEKILKNFIKYHNPSILVEPTSIEIITIIPH